MQKQIKFPENSKSKLNPKNFIQSPKKYKLNSSNKKFKVKKFKKSSLKQTCLRYSDNPLYDSLQTQENIKGNQMNIGPWIRQKTKQKQENHIPSKNIAKKCDQNQQMPIKTLQLQIQNKSQCFQQLVKNQTQINSNKLVKNIKKDRLFLQIPVSAILQQQEIQISNYLPQIFYKKALFKLRQTSLDFGIHKKQGKRSIIHIQQSQELSLHKQRNTQSNKAQAKLRETKSEKMLQKYSSRLFFEKKIIPNVNIYTYRKFYDDQTVSATINFRSTSLQRMQNKQSKIYQNIKEEILKKKVNGVNIKISPPNQKINKIKNPIYPQKQSLQQQLIKDLIQLRQIVK